MAPCIHVREITIEILRAADERDKSINVLRLQITEIKQKRFLGLHIHVGENYNRGSKGSRLKR